MAEIYRVYVGAWREDYGLTIRGFKSAEEALRIRQAIVDAGILDDFKPTMKNNPDIADSEKNKLADDAKTVDQAKNYALAMGMPSSKIHTVEEASAFLDAIARDCKKYGSD